MSDDNQKENDPTAEGGKGPIRLVPIPLIPTKRKLGDNHLQNLRESGLSDETISLALLYTEDRPKVLAELVQRRTWVRLQGSALVFPFYLPTPDGALIAVRVRPTTPLIETGKNGKKRARKYDQASAHGLLIYFTPRARMGNRYADASVPLFWTEGEKKALVFDQEGLACVGLTGVWNWIDTDHKRESGGEERPHPILRQHVTLAGRPHVIVFDSDARKNDQVMLAAQRLCGVLHRAGATDVRFVCPPEGPAKGIDDYYALHGAEATHALLRSAQPIEPVDAKTLVAVRKCQAYRDAEMIAPTLRIPEGYELQRDGSLWRSANDEQKGDAKVTASPIFLTRVLVDRYSGEQRADLAWCFDGVWHTLCASRRAVVDSRALVAELGPLGAPVTSSTAGKLVDFLDAFTHANASQIPRIQSVATTGWHHLADQRVFVASEPIGTSAVALDTRGDRKPMFAALTPRGTLEGHLQALRKAWEASPLAAAMICGALAAPLLEPLRCSNFAIHLVGESSRGKTSMLKIGASVYGDPSVPQWLASWNATMSGAEARASILCDLPQCYDEIGGGDAQQAERMLYALINGGGRTRATRDMGARETSSWRTIVLSTGERELADEGTATGAQVRVVQLAVEGFGELDASEVDAVRAECCAHAGSLGHEWLQELASVDDWGPYRTALLNVTAKLRTQVSDPLQGRVAAYFGLLALTEAMLTERFELGRNGHTFSELFAALGKREQIQSMAQRAREQVEAWVAGEPDGFPELQLNSAGGLDEPKSNGARVRRGYRRPDGTVLVIAPEFRAMCRKARLESRAVVREWQRLGWTELDGHRLDKQVRVGETRARYIILLTTAAPTIETPTPESW